MSIVVDGDTEAIPAEVGIVSTCMSEIHTHDTSGTIHAESITPGKTFTLSQFFNVWGKDLIRDGYTLSATANGKNVPDPTEIVLKDGQELSLSYSASPSL